jgi:hypothetical protein
LLNTPEKIRKQRCMAFDAMHRYQLSDEVLL